MSLLQASFWRRWSSVVVVVVVAMTLIICVTLTKINHIYTGGLAWPFFSDTGRDPPTYYVFCVGLSITAVLVACTYYFNYEYQFKILRFAKQTANTGCTANYYARVLWMSRFVCFCGMFSVIGLPGLSIWDTANYPGAHVMFAYGFFAVQVIALLCNTHVSHQIQRFLELQINSSSSSSCEAQDVYRILDAATAEEGTHTIKAKWGVNHQLLQCLASKAKRTFRWQMVLVIFFFLAFLVYIPIGKALPGHSKRLTIQECLDRQYGEDYCTNHMKLDATRTKLHNYENCYFKGQLRALGQVCCVLTLICYSLTFQLHESERVDQLETRKQIQTPGPCSSTYEQGV